MGTKGYNRADAGDNLSYVFDAFVNKEISGRPCVFLSHKREDKAACRIIAEYFKEAEIDYYLDEDDRNLQYASQAGDPLKITECIKNGIKKSTHMMVVISEKTYKSQWVPFEVGYGHASILDQEDLNSKSNNLKLSVLTLKDISDSALPDYLQVGHIIRGTNSLNEYIQQITEILEKSLLNEGRIIPSYNQNHPLDGVLNWKK
ncbi:toll/interleukin-1 receptor domain-containing protein [Sphingobacterium sp. UGAL515B_05]|uniref:toll/interleukin-1 receptor domain-containing protein n=1 Tax=Sphingobacterium sp. UGAL515B_05 TaxID=2986767 RepID=UPI0029545402|nr:toll/interleukin-1 receptor domain-containing protein [Sphingobacterium sp. UGAL515B_05]WON93821.1 toll/interleukin-1 receptor domain-containing protein [Sphingobacterium sp. UGAL515B_05]